MLLNGARMLNNSNTKSKFLCSLILIISSSSVYQIQSASGTIQNPWKHIQKGLKTKITAYCYGTGQGQETLEDISGLSEITVAKIFTPKTIIELQNFLRNNEYKGPISIKGGGFSQGWQTACVNGTVIDLVHLNKVIHFDKEEKKITVQANITWHELQKYIDLYDLSVKVMQSYHDFSVGGSLGVNVHGRDIGYGPLIQTVESIKIVTADGTMLNASRQENADLFRAAIGGYGGLGIIVEVTLCLTENVMLELKTREIALNTYNQFFHNTIQCNGSTVVMQNANVYPNDFDTALIFEWHQTNKTPTNHARMQECRRFHWRHMIGEQCARRLPPFAKLRYKLEASQKEYIVHRNHEMGHCTNALEPLMRWPTTSILQEYFIPVDQLNAFLDKTRKIIKENKVNVLNISIRYVPEDTDSTLAYARSESFAFVFYINVSRSNNYAQWREKWTQELIDASLDLGGTFYLPYQLYATKEQFNRAYGDRVPAFLAAKNKYDPHGLFNNEMLKKYI